MSTESSTNLFRRTGEGQYELDLAGYGCPHVQIYTGKALDRLQEGEDLTIVFDSPASGESIAWLLKSQGHEITTRQEAGGTFTWTIRKA